MAKATPLKIGTGSGKPRGEFKIEKFSLFDEGDLEKYAELRNKEANRANGIEFEFVREYSRKTVTVTGEGQEMSTTTTEEIILVVHYWEKPVARVKGDSPDEVRDSKSTLVSR